MEITYTENEIWSIMDNVMKAALEFYQGDWIGFLDVNLELGLWNPVHWYTPTDDETRNLPREFESSKLLCQWVDAMHKNAEIIIPDLLAVPVKSEPTGFFVVCNPKSHTDESGKLQFLTSVFSNLVNEKKRVERLKVELSPENIEHDTNTYGVIQKNSEAISCYKRKLNGSGRLL